MLPQRFELHRPSSLNEALTLADAYGDGSTFYAGGTEVLLAMKARVLRYEHVIDLKRIMQLRGISERSDGTVVIGALVTHHQLATDPLIRKRLPAYAALSNNVANIRVRVTGTVGGNLCFAEPHADGPALLCALRAKVVLLGSKGERSLPLQDFILGEFTTARTDGEILTRVEIPPLPAGARQAYVAFGHLERPAAGVGVVGMPRPSGVEWRIWVGAASGRPTSLPDVERAVLGLDGARAIDAVVETAPGAVELLDVRSDMHGAADYKRHLVTVLTRRAVAQCVG